MGDECLELKNIKYQTMLLNNNSNTKETKPNISSITTFLEKEKELNHKKPWSKLGKATKLKRLNEYINDYSIKHKLNGVQKTQLKTYLLHCLERKKLQRQKDVIYDVKTNKIKSIPGLVYNKTNNKYTLKRPDKKTSTLKCLAPKKPRKGSKTNKKRRKKIKQPNDKPPTDKQPNNKIDNNLKDN